MENGEWRMENGEWICLGVLMNSSQRLKAAEKKLLPVFYDIDLAVKENLNKVLDAFRRHRVGVHHFAGVTGYGHDDLRSPNFGSGIC